MQDLRGCTTLLQIQGTPTTTRQQTRIPHHTMTDNHGTDFAIGDNVYVFSFFGS